MDATLSWLKGKVSMSGVDTAAAKEDFLLSSKGLKEEQE